MKKYLMASLAVAFAVCSAFGIRQTNHQFEFIGDSTDWQDRVDENMYIKVSSLVCPAPEEKLCKIVTPDANNDNKPDIGTSGALFNALKNSQLSTPDFTPANVVGEEL